MLTKQKFSFAFELVVSTPKSFSLRLSRLVIVGAPLEGVPLRVCLQRDLSERASKVGSYLWDAATLTRTRMRSARSQPRWALTH